MLATSIYAPVIFASSSFHEQGFSRIGNYRRSQILEFLVDVTSSLIQLILISRLSYR